MEFLSRTHVILVVGAVGLALLVLDLVRRRRLSEEYSLLWVVATALVAILGFSTPLLRAITGSLGIRYETSTVFAFGLAFAIVVLLFLSVKLSRLSQENRMLTRELSFLRLELEELRAGGPPRGGAGA